MNVLKSKVLYFSAVCTLIFGSAEASAKTMLFGGPGSKQYLGCIECSEYAPDSICNGFGTFGNEFSAKGMFNEYAGFGNEYSSKSPWNEFSLSKEVPILVDDKGNFFGYFTINDSRADAVPFSSALKAIFKRADGDLEKVRVGICKGLGYSG